MIHRRRRFVDMVWIHHRMHEQDARRQLQAGTLFPGFLEPEVVPFVEVEIVPAKDTEDTQLQPVVEVVLVPKPDGGDQ